MNQFPAPAVHPSASASQQTSPQQPKIPSSSPQPPYRRSQRPQSRRKKKAALSVPQAAVLGVLLLGIILSAFSWIQGTNETAELKNQHINEKREYDRIQAEYQQQIRQHLMKYEDWIRYYAAVYNLDPSYVAAIIMTESSYRPEATNARTGATGLMQFMADTLEWVGPKFGVGATDMEALKDPETAIKLGCYLLNYITKQFDGDPILTACAYHAGWGNVRAWITKYSADGKTLTIDQIPTSDTRHYAGKVLNSYAIYQQYYY